MNHNETLLNVLRRIDGKEIAIGMREFAEAFGEPDFAFHCYDGCRCGANCGDDDDCFACGDKYNLGDIEWRKIKEYEDE